MSYEDGSGDDATPSPADGWRIVLIDDESDIREITAITLEDAGYRVSTAADGEQGLAMCREVAPQIVVTDIRMPKMDGIDVLSALKSERPEVEVIVVTAFGEMDVAIQALRLDASDFITKPISNDALHLALDRARERYTDRKRRRDYTELLETAHAQTLRELIRTVTFQENLIEGSMDGIMACDAEENVVIYNRAAEAILGIAKKEALNGARLDRFFPAGEKARLREAVNGGGYGGPHRLSLYETTLLGADRDRIPVQLSAAVLFGEEQETGLVLFLRDLREIRRLEREMADQARILHQDKMMSLGRLAASVVHEINNPLSGILNYLRLMGRMIGRGPLTAERQEKFAGYLDLVEKETERCSRIISSLLTFSRKSPPAFGEVDVADVLNRCVLLSQHKLDLSNIRLTADVDGDLPPIRGDANGLQQCVINLIFNAIDAMPRGGDLTLSGRHDRKADRVEIRVADTGTGIPEPERDHIFEPFHTTKKEGHGVGLGLSTVYGIVQRHGGDIDVESREGEGTAFTIRLPVQAGREGTAVG